MANVIREDVVQIGFEIENGPLQKLTKEMDNIKRVLTGALGEDVFSGITEEAKKAQNSVKGLGEEAKKTGSSTSAFEKFKNSIKQTVQSLTGGEKGVKGFVNALKNIGKISVNKLKSGLTGVGTKLTEIAKKAGGAAYNGLKKLAGISFKALGAGLAAAATGVGVIVKKSVQSFGEYEQLKGGMEKIFDQGDTAKIMQDAQGAYKDLGLSANDYLRIINDTGATFAAVMGDKKGYETARTGLTAISDYASGTGKSVDLLSEKFSMITRSTSSYQSIADQFSGILPATSKDFLKQAQAAGFLDKKYKELTKVPVAEYQEAVSKMLEKGVADLGLAGNTAAEACSTLTGSLGMTKAAWQNLLTAMASGEDLGPYIENMIESASAAAKMLVPVIKQALSGIGTVIKELAPIISAELPGLIGELLPDLISAASELVSALVVALPDIVNASMPAIKQALTLIGSAIYEAFTGKELSGDELSAFSDKVSNVVDSAKKAIPVIIGLVAAFKLFNTIKTVSSAIGSFAKGIGSIAQKVSGGLGSKMTTVADGMNKTGTSAKTSSGSMLTSAKAFALMGVGVLAVAIGFGILAAASIMLANSGGAAIGVMFGMVAALAALGFGMVAAIQALAPFSGQALQVAGAMAAMGGAVVLIAAGFAILAFAAISVANAGGAAIAVLFGLVASMAALMVVAALVAPALTAGAVGLLAFGAAVVLAGAGALLFAAAVAVMTPPLLQLLPVVAMVVSVIVQQIGTVLVNIIRQAGDSISQICDSIGGVFKDLGSAISEVVTSISDGIATITTAIGDAISGVLDSLAGIIDSIGTAALNAGMGFKLAADGLRQISEISLVDLIKSLGALGDAMSMMAENGTGLSQAGTGLQNIVSALTTMSVIAPLVSASSTTIAQVFTQLNAVTPNLVTAISGLSPALMSIVAPMSIIPMHFAMFSGTLQSTAASMLIFVGTLTLINSLFTMFSGAVTRASSGLLTMAAGFAVLVGSITTVSNSVKSLGKDIDKFSSGVEKAVSAAEKQFNNLPKAVSKVCGEVVSTIEKMIGDVKSALDGANLQSSGEHMINGLIRGINSKKSAAVSAARSIANAINREFDKIQKIASPSKVWTEKGKFLIQGGINGMEKMLPAMRNTAIKAAEMSMPYSGRTPETSATYTTTRNSNTEYNSYAPVFNLSVGGSTDDRATARKVKQLVKQAMSEMIESAGRKTPKLQRI